MGDRSWTLHIDALGRPLLANAVHRMHHHQVAKARGQWRDTATILARAQRIPSLPCIALTVQARYRTRRSPSDCDAPSPALKGVLDGLVRAGVVPDDGPPYVSSVTYLAPVLGTGEPDALVVTVADAGVPS